MPVIGRAWAKRHLGFDPASDASSSLLDYAYRADNASGRLDLAKPANLEALQETLIEYDPFAKPSHPGLALLQTGLPPSKTLAKIPWPKDLAPLPVARVSAGPDQPLAQCDVLIVTWTTAEAQALSQVLTPGHFSATDWKHYTHKFASYVKQITGPHAPAKFSKRLGSYWVTKIGIKKVICFKSELHMDQDGPALPVKMLMQQLLSECNPSILITTGTAGGIGSDMELGDVIATGDVAFDCTTKFRNEFGSSAFSLPPMDSSCYPEALRLMRANLSKIPRGRGALKIVHFPHAQAKDGIVTTDFFAFDDSANRFGLQGKGKAVEMGDAVLAMICKNMGRRAPRFVAIRNASDPQIDGSLPYEQQVKIAAGIYMKYGYWTTVCSAIATWAAIAA